MTPPREAGTIDGQPEPDGETVRAGTPAQGRELRAQGRRTMQKLLDAGVQVFSDKGYHATRVDDIVKVAETSHGTFYLYFSNKEDLFAALVSEVAEELATITEALGPITNDDQGRLVLRAWINEFAEVYDRHGTVIRSWTEAEAGSSEVGAIGTEVLSRIAQSLADHIDAPASNELGGDTGRQVIAMAIVAMVERFNYFVHSEQVTADPEAIIDTLTATTFAGLFGS
jgi:AcrR family transcriptional regulator